VPGDRLPITDKRVRAEFTCHIESPFVTGSAVYDDRADTRSLKHKQV
jgi:hypothetical protein